MRGHIGQRNSATGYRPNVAHIGAWQYGRVLHDLEAAADAYEAAQDRITEAERALAEARAAAPGVRRRLHQAIVVAAQAGARQVEIIEVTGYSREQVRRILRAGGVEAD